MKKLPDWAFVFAPFVILLPFASSFTFPQWLAGELGWISLVMMTGGGLLGVYSERQSESANTSSRTTWRTRVRVAVVVTIIGSALGAIDQITSGRRTYELLTKSLEVSAENTELAKENAKLLTGGNSLFYLNFGGSSAHGKIEPYLAIDGSYDIPEVMLEVSDIGAAAKAMAEGKTTAEVDALTKRAHFLGRIAKDSGLAFINFPDVARGQTGIFEIRVIQGRMRAIQYVLVERYRTGELAFASRLYRYSERDGRKELRLLPQFNFTDSSIERDENGEVLLIDSPDKIRNDMVVVSGAARRTKGSGDD